MAQSPDRLYELLPGVYRLRDAERGYPLRDLLRVIAEQVTAVEDDITQLYDDWFIETASDWAVPYIADLVGYQPVLAAGNPAASRGEENRILVPRRDVANTIAFRRRRGTLSVLELLAQAVAGWPTRAVEFYRLLGWTQNLNHQQSRGYRARVATLRDANELERIGTAFDAFARTVDVRRISSRRSQGRSNIPNVGLFAWRLKAYPVTHAPAFCLDAGKNQYTFSVLGNDAPLFTRPVEEAAPTDIAGELNVPAPIRRRAFDAAKDQYYGRSRSVTIWVERSGRPSEVPIPASAIVAADLSNWHYVPPAGRVAVDPRLGRLAFPRTQPAERHVRVSYHYGFSADIGGGEYDRQLLAPAAYALYTVGQHGTYKRVAQALAAWRSADPRDAVIEIGDSNVYVEQLGIELGEGQSLQIRAANRARPVIRLLDWQTDMPDALTVKMAARSRFTLDGLLLTGRALDVTGISPPAGDHQRAGGTPSTKHENPRNPVCPSEVVIRHCTLVPGWTIDTHCRPSSPNKESISLTNVRAKVRIEHSIIGPVEVAEDEVRNDPIPLAISDTIIDAMDGDREAIIGPSGRHAHVVLDVRRSTIFGIVQVHAIELAENSVFVDCLHVARRQLGCVRFCSVPRDCRTPRRFHCQPDLVVEQVRTRLAGADPTVVTAAQAREVERVRPRFSARHYGQPAYAQLSSQCALEIRTGADDGSEMGVFHDLFQPQRMANLQARLAAFTPSGSDAGVIVVS